MRTFGHRRKIRDKSGQIIGEKSSPPAAITRNEYYVLYSKSRKIVVSCDAGDVLTFRELGRRQKWYLAVETAFRYAVKMKAQADALIHRKPKHK